MTAGLLSLHQELRVSSRLAPPDIAAADRIRARELAILIFAGIAAAVAVGYPDFSLRIPGNAILRAVFPMACGLALAPRRMGGMVMGLSAGVTASVLTKVGGAGIGMGALTSLWLVGPLLDLALWRARPGWSLYLSFAAACWAGNLAAFAVRGAGKAAAVGPPAMRTLAEWMAVAPVTYSLCGIVAGLISAAVWFRLHADDEPAAR